MNSKHFAAFLGFGVASLFSGLEQEIGPVIVRVFDLSIALAMVGVFVSMSMHRNFQIPSLGLPAILFVLLMFYRAINGSILASVVEGVIELIQGIEFVLLIYFIVYVFRSDKNSDVFLFSFICSILIILVINTVYHIHIGKYTWYKALNEPKLTYGIMGLVMTARYLSTVHRKTIWGLATTLSLVMMVLSTERKGWVALIVAGLFAVFVEQRHSWRSVVGARRVIAGLVLFAVGMAAFIIIQRNNTTVRHHFTSMVEAPRLVDWESGDINYSMGSTPSMIVRTYLLDFSIRSIKSEPLFGIGSNEFKSRMAAVAGLEMRYENSNHIGSGLKARISEGFGAHNEYAMYAVENGIIGLLLYVGIWAMIFVRALSLHKIRLPTGRMRYRRLLATMFVVYGAVINLFLGGGATNTMFLALPIALVLGMERQVGEFYWVQRQQHVQDRRPLQGEGRSHR